MQANFSITFDYRFDTGFFDDQARRDVMDAAAAEWSALIQDEFDDIGAGSLLQVIDPTNPGSIVDFELQNTIDDLLIMIGTADLGGNAGGSMQLGQANLLFGAGDGDAQRARTAFDFKGQGPVTDFEPFLGSITFNDNAAVDWSFDLNEAVPGKSDLYATALHEIAHVLGLAGSPAFTALSTAAGFIGPNSLAQNNGNPIPLEADGHVEEGFAGNAVVIDPIAATGDRLSPSDIDLALLADIGYEIDGFDTQGMPFELTTNGNDGPLFGSSGADLMDGMGGADVLLGANGDDTILGGDGQDELWGQGGHDALSGGAADDQLIGGTGSDFVDGGAGSDTVVLHEANALLDADERDWVVLNSSVGTDVVFGFDPSNDVLRVSSDLGFDTPRDVLAGLAHFNDNTFTQLSNGAQTLATLLLRGYDIETGPDDPTASDVGFPYSLRNIEVFTPGAIPEDVLEFAARDTAYNATLDDVGQFISGGYRVAALFEDDDVFAVALTPALPDMGAAILAIREIHSDEDVAFSTPSAQAIRDVWEGSSGLQDWIAANPGAHLTGRAQGGTIAQLIAAFATQDGLQVGDIRTFNAPGLEASEADLFDATLAGSVVHNVSSGDVLQLLGETYLPGAVERYAFDAFSPDASDPLARIFDYITDTHSDHLSNPSTGLGAVATQFGSAPDGFTRDSNAITSDQLAAADFTFLIQQGQVDVDYVLFLISLVHSSGNVAGVTGASAASSLTARGGANEAGLSVQQVLDFLNGIRNGDVSLDPVTAQLFVAMKETISTWDAPTGQLLLDWGVHTWVGIGTWDPDMWVAARGFSEDIWAVVQSLSPAQWEAVRTWDPETWEAFGNVSADAQQMVQEGSAALLMQLETGGLAQVQAIAATAASILGDLDVETQGIVAQFLRSDDGIDFLLRNPNLAEIPSPLSGRITGTQADTIFVSPAGATQLIDSESDIDTLDVFLGTLDSLNGDQITGFDANDVLFLAGTVLSPDMVSIRAGSAIIDIDLEGDGVIDSTVQLNGDFDVQGFEIASTGGNTTLRISSENAAKLTASGERFITTDIGPNNVFGAAGSDAIVTSGGADILAAAAGDDLLLAGSGDDVLIGGTGGDQMSGGLGRDIFAFNASDFVAGGLTADFITDFQIGEDVIELNGFGLSQVSDLSFSSLPQGDALILGAGHFVVLDGVTAAALSDADFHFNTDARVYGLAGTRDVTQLSAANDRFLTTGTLANEVFGGSGDDVILGAGGSDTLRGGFGDDVLNGGVGDDLLIGGADGDRLTGGLGADNFVFHAGENAEPTIDFIVDFETSVDQVTLNGFGLTHADLNFINSASSDLALLLTPSEFIVFEGISQTSDLGVLTDVFMLG
ncbi:MAG: hypothetical protein AB8B71_05425 [Paracoccaceae bacterium]